MHLPLIDPMPDSQYKAFLNLNLLIFRGTLLPSIDRPYPGRYTFFFFPENSFIFASGGLLLTLVVQPGLQL